MAPRIGLVLTECSMSKADAWKLTGGEGSDSRMARSLNDKGRNRGLDGLEPISISDGREDGLE